MNNLPLPSKQMIKSRIKLRPHTVSLTESEFRLFSASKKLLWELKRVLARLDLEHLDALGKKGILDECRPGISAAINDAEGR